MIQLDEEQRCFVERVAQLEKGGTHALLAPAGSGKTTAVLAAAAQLSALVLAHTKASCNVISGRCMDNSMQPRVRTIHSLAYHIVSTSENASEHSFDEMLQRATEHLENTGGAGICSAFGCTVSLVIVDEFQDITELQYLFVVALKKALQCALVVVGDGMQDIFRFRGSRTVFAQMLSDGCTYTRLVNNYRSCPEIVELANSLVAKGGSVGSTLMSPVKGAGGVIRLEGFRGVHSAYSFVMRTLEDCFFGRRTVLVCASQVRGRHKLLAEVHQAYCTRHPERKVFFSGCDTGVPMEKCDAAFSTVHGAKGGGWHTVIYIDTGSFPTETADEGGQRINRLYTAWTRAECALHHVCLYNWCPMPCTLDSNVQRPEICLFERSSVAINAKLHKGTRGTPYTKRCEFSLEMLAVKIPPSERAQEVLSKITSCEPIKAPAAPGVLGACVELCMQGVSRAADKAAAFLAHVGKGFVYPAIPLGERIDPTAFVGIHNAMITDGDNGRDNGGGYEKLYFKCLEVSDDMHRRNQQISTSCPEFSELLGRVVRYVNLAGMDVRRDLYTHKACQQYGMFGERCRLMWKSATLDEAELGPMVAGALMQLCLSPHTRMIRTAVLHWDTFDLRAQWQFTGSEKKAFLHACHKATQECSPCKEHIVVMGGLKGVEIDVSTLPGLLGAMVNEAGLFDKALCEVQSDFGIVGIVSRALAPPGSWNLVGSRERLYDVIGEDNSPCAVRVPDERVLHACSHVVFGAVEEGLPKSCGAVIAALHGVGTCVVWQPEMRKISVVTTTGAFLTLRCKKKFA